jgi:hypothetical protein
MAITDSLAHPDDEDTRRGNAPPPPKRSILSR